MYYYYYYFRVLQVPKKNADKNIFIYTILTVREQGTYRFQVACHGNKIEANERTNERTGNTKKERETSETTGTNLYFTQSHSQFYYIYTQTYICTLFTLSRNCFPSPQNILLFLFAYLLENNIIIYNCRRIICCVVYMGVWLQEGKKWYKRFKIYRNSIRWDTKTISVL